jgi:hypothetical protein
LLYPVRDLGSNGVFADIDPYATPIRQFTFASNARFENKKITRAPVFLKSGPLVSAAAPRGVVAYQQLTGAWKFHVASYDGRVFDWVSGGIGSSSVETDISPTGYTPSNYSAPFTSCILNDVVYINRPDRVPWFKTVNGSQFATLPNVGGLGWNPEWRCKSLREIAGVLVAINITKNGVAYPTMVKTSDYMLFGTPPGQWTATTTNSATENVIADLHEPLVDGFPLRDRLVLYSQRETWMMEPRYDNVMFNYRRLFSERGVISQNCVVDVDNIHYVFGPTDIWMHDGFSPKSIAAGRVRDFIYGNMVTDSHELFFVQHNARLNEIMFCYLSTDQHCRFPVGGNYGYPGCNRAAVYNYRADTWYFYDLPYITDAGIGIPFADTAYSSLSSLSYEDIGVTSYSSFSSLTAAPGLLTVSPEVVLEFGTIASAVRSFDRYASNVANGVFDRAATAPVYVDKTGIDMDEFNENLKAYKTVKSIYPDGRLTVGSTPLLFAWGSGDYPSSPVEFSEYQSYDGQVTYKLDYRTSGRFLAFRISYDDPRDFSLSGLDFEYEALGRR